MVFSGLTRALISSGTFSSALATADRDADFSLTPGLNAPLLVAMMRERARTGESRALLAVTATSRETESLRDALRARPEVCFMNGSQIHDWFVAQQPA